MLEQQALPARLVTRGLLGLQGLQELPAQTAGVHSVAAQRTFPAL